MTDLPPLPNFVVLGAHRAATRWLRNHLAAHPDVHLPRGTVPYLSGGTELGLRGYRLQFHEADGSSVVGEVNPYYLSPSPTDPVSGTSRTARRVEETLGSDVRLVALVRDPVDRMVSAHRDDVVHGVHRAEPGLYDLLAMGPTDARAAALVGDSCYAANLYPFRRRFGDRLLVLPVDDLADDPVKAYRTVLEHLGLDPTFEPPHLDRVLYSNAHTRWADSSLLDDEQRRTAYMLVRDDIEELEAMMGRYLPAWDPGPPPPTWRDDLTAWQR